ncbi:unnamed protein product [Rangifer tarandus platyrhynchus]|uniref:Uncharacterized protein n=2 Tax=Rangifer tarandus platyrhynchus TaxID=3082113 RepID=A0ABN8ZIF3_RANTA|nr:unnamed protein product [Rangifer tarandus platyrhynchus]CAI9707592.1 unnamed protein product [Rangifer tarandus platyrhynchus]
MALPRSLGCLVLGLELEGSLRPDSPFGPRRGRLGRGSRSRAGSHGLPGTDQEELLTEAPCWPFSGDPGTSGHVGPKAKAAASPVAPLSLGAVQSSLTDCQEHWRPSGARPLTPRDVYRTRTFTCDAVCRRHGAYRPAASRRGLKRLQHAHQCLSSAWTRARLQLWGARCYRQF